MIQVSMKTLGGSKCAHSRYVLGLGQDLSHQSAMPSPHSDKEPSHEFTFMDDLPDADFSISGLDQMPLDDYGEHENLGGKQRCSFKIWMDLAQYASQQSAMSPPPAVFSNSKTSSSVIIHSSRVLICC
jgi:hypothetical protein